MDCYYKREKPVPTVGRQCPQAAQRQFLLMCCKNSNHITSAPVKNVGPESSHETKDKSRMWAILHDSWDFRRLDVIKTHKNCVLERKKGGNAETSLDLKKDTVAKCNA